MSAAHTAVLYPACAVAQCSSLCATFWCALRILRHAEVFWYYASGAFLQTIDAIASLRFLDVCTPALLLPQVLAWHVPGGMGLLARLARRVAGTDWWLRTLALGGFIQTGMIGALLLAPYFMCLPDHTAHGQSSNGSNGSGDGTITRPTHAQTIRHVASLLYLCVCRRPSPAVVCVLAVVLETCSL